MKTQTLKRDLCTHLGVCLEYPDEDTQGHLDRAIQEIEAVSLEAATYLKDFCAQVGSLDLPAQQEQYVKTFDVMPQCSLYLSIHLFGEESFKRAELMTGLKSVYEKHGSFGMTELPDHLGIVLKLNSLFENTEWDELVSMGLLKALPKMIAELEKCKNVYVLILKAVRLILTETEQDHA